MFPPFAKAGLLSSLKNPLLRGAGVCLFPIAGHTPLSPLKRGMRELNSPAFAKGGG